MRSKMTVITTISLVVFAFALASEGLAKNGGTTVVWGEVEADLEPFCTIVPPATSCSFAEPDAEGRAEHRTKTHKGLLERDEFKARLEIPIPNGLGIDETNAATADIRLILTHPAFDTTPAMDYAECFFKFKGTETEEEDGLMQTKAHYAVDIRSRLNKRGGPGLRELKGTCDIDLGTMGIQPGVPDAQDGDLATAVLVTENPDPTMPDTRTSFLQGMFED